MTYPLTNYSRVWVRGRFIDIRKAVNQETNYGLAGTVTFVPSPEDALIDADLKMILGLQRFTATPAVADGYFAVQLPATDDPQINPTGWTYAVTEPTGRTYNITVPYNTPTLVASGDPLDGQQVIELSNVVPNPDPNPGTVQLLVGQTGRGISSVTVNGSNHLIITWTDSTTTDIGAVTYTPAAHTHEAVDLKIGSIAPIFHTDFTGTNGAGWPAGFTMSATTQDIQSNQGRLGTGASANVTAAARLAPVADGEVLFRAKWTSADASSRFLGWMFREVDTSNRYEATISATAVTLAKRVAGTATTIATGAGSYAIDTFHWFRVKWIGSDLRMKVWTDGSAEPNAWTLTGTDGTYSLPGAANGLIVPSGTSGSAATAAIDDLRLWSLAAPRTGPVTLTDGATVALDASLGKVHKLTVASGAASSTHTISVPTNPADGAGIIIVFRNESSNVQTLALTTGTTGSFRFSATVTALSSTAAGKTDYVGVVYLAAASRFDVLSYVKGA